MVPLNGAEQKIADLPSLMLSSSHLMPGRRFDVLVLVHSLAFASIADWRSAMGKIPHRGNHGWYSGTTPASTRADEALE